MSDVINEASVKARDLVLDRIFDDRQAMASGLDESAEGVKALFAMYDRGVSAALTAVEEVGSLVVSLKPENPDALPEPGLTVHELADSFWARVNN